MKNEEMKPVNPPRWVGPVLFVLSAGIVFLLGLLAVSIMERRWETTRPSMVLKPIAQWEPNNAVWGQNYPREYETYLKTKDDTTKTLFGGAFPRDYLEEDPRQVLLFSGYPFSIEYKQARGHYHSVEDVTTTKRVNEKNVAACWTCKSTDVPRKMAELGVQGFYDHMFADFVGEITHPIGCQDCHDPATMNLRITRPALREAFAARGLDIDQASHQEMRSLVCAQCHVEYYFQNKHTLTFPWKNGMKADDMIRYYDDLNFSDYVHAISKTPIIKAQHPDFEAYSTGIHAYRGISCADCHMPYRTEGGVKFTDHHVQSPLLNIANSCAVCHRWGEDEIKQRVEAIQTKTFTARLSAENALVKAHFDIAAAMQAGVSDEALALPRKTLRHAQFKWDYVSAHNGMGFHSPQECMRLLGEAVDGAQQARLEASRLLAAKGISTEPNYPDYSTRENASGISKSFEDGKPLNLL